MPLGSGTGWKRWLYLTLLLSICVGAAVRIALLVLAASHSTHSAAPAPVVSPTPAAPQKIELSPEYLAQKVPPPRISGRYPCVYVDMSSESPAPKIGECGMSSLFFSQPVDRFEVDLRYGNFVLRQTDLFLQDDFAVPFTRTYNSFDWFYGQKVRAFGSNSNHTYDIGPAGPRNPYTWQGIALEDANFVCFSRISPGPSYLNAVFRHSETSSIFYKAITWWNGTGWTTRLVDGTKIFFPESYYAKKIADGAPFEIDDPAGHKLMLNRDADRNLQEIRTPHGHTISVSYNPQGRISRTEDDAGHWTIYFYNGEGMLVSAASSSGKERRYQYDGNQMIGIQDENGNMLLRNRYVQGRIVAQQFADGQIYQYAYRWANDGNYAVAAFVKPSDGPAQEISTDGSVPNEMRGIDP